MNKILTLFFLLFSLAVSAQNEITWVAGQNIAANSFGNMHPRMALDGSGNPMVIWGKMADQSVYFSRWNGVMFSMPVKLNPPWLTVATQTWMGPDIASSGDTVYVVMKRTPESSDTNHVYLVRSFDGGLNFSAPSRVDFIVDSVSRFPTVAVDPSGNPIVAFMKFNPNFSRARWVVCRSMDFGNTFTTDVKASGWSGVGSDVCDCCPGSLVASGNTVAMIYRDNNANIRDTWTGLSTNGGASFSSGWNPDQHNWYLPACPSSGPDGVIYGDSLYSVHMNGYSGMNRVYLGISSISGQGAQPSRLLTGNIMGLSQQNYPRIASSGTAIAAVWKQVVNGADQLPILFTNDIANGFPMAYDTVDLNNITNADVALYNGNAYVVWQDDNSGTVKFRRGTYPVLINAVDEAAIESFSIFPNPAKDEFTIRLPQFAAQMEGLSCTLTDMQGRRLKHWNIDGFAGNTYHVPVRNLATGVYVLTFWKDGKALESVELKIEN